MFPSYIYFSIHLCGPNHFYVYSHFSFSWTRCLAISVRSEGTVKSKCEWKTQQIHLGKENKRRLPKAAFNHVWTWSAVAARCFRGSRVRSGFARRHGILTGPWAWTLKRSTFYINRRHFPWMNLLFFLVVDDSHLLRGRRHPPNRVNTSTSPSSTRLPSATILLLRSIHLP